MIILLMIFVAIIAAAIIFDRDGGEVAGTVTLLGIATIAMMLLIWVTTYHSGKSQIVQYGVFKTTVENMKADGIDMTDAAINVKILETNDLLANARYWNGTMFDRAIPDELAELPYLK